MEHSGEIGFLLFSIPLYSILIGAELIMSHWKHLHYYTLAATLQNIYLTLLNAALDFLLRGLFYVSVLMYCYHHAWFDIDNPFLYWPLLFVLEDFFFYVEHRVDHFCRLFWAVHVTHHSSEEFNLTTGFRSSVLQPVYRFVYFIPLAFMGFHPMDIVFMYSLTQTYGILVHTQMIKKMPAWFETIFVSPSHHRVHHASNMVYLDKNMGMCLIIWDKLFGTFQPELDEVPVVYGLNKPIPHPHHPVKMISHEWEAMIKDVKKKTGFKNKLKYIFMPPGWSHDGSSLTSAQLRRANPHQPFSNQKQ